MSIARKIIDRENVNKEELLYILYITLCELELYSGGSVKIDGNESFSVPELANALEAHFEVNDDE